MQKSRALLVVLSLIGAIGITYACISGNEMDNESLKQGDAGLLAPIRFHFETELALAFGKIPETAKYHDYEPASRYEVLGEVLVLLDRDLERRGDARRGEKMAAMTKLVNWLRERSGDLEDGEDVMRELNSLPPEFGIYLGSLTGEDEWALKRTDALLALPRSRRNNLTALAHYRKARLLMNMTRWDSMEDAEARERLGLIRQHLQMVMIETKKGAPDIARISQAAKGWMAHSFSVIMSYGKLERLGEADPGAAIKAYLELRNDGERMGENSLYLLARNLPKDYSAREACANNPLMRRLVTLYLCSGRSWISGQALEQTPPYDAGAWVDTLKRAKVDFSEDAARIAALQYFGGRYADCEQTLALCPKDDPTAALLRSRMELRLGRKLEARDALAAAVSKLPNEAHPAAWMTHPYVEWRLPGEKDIYLRRTIPGSLHGRARAELAVLELGAGRHLEALRQSMRAGVEFDTCYLAECVLTIEELKSFLDTEGKEPLMRVNWEVLYGPERDAKIDAYQLLRDLLVRRLCRANRWEEALPYATAELAGSIREHVRLMAVAADEKTDKRVRADAYWKSAVVIWHKGRDLLYCNFGPRWSSSGGWYADDWPAARSRISQDYPWQPLSGAGEEERKRVEAWLGANYNPPNKGHRVAKYEVLRLAIKAAELLPDNDPAGAKILQLAGSQMMYLDPPVANEAYKLLATRFKETEYGKYAFEKRWFMKPEMMKAEDGGGEEPEPDPEWVAK